ncbi:MAG: energy-coupled thiamine transporter ThiT [Bacilli bacterium]|nr:energy-coupled thiamine transporter ThiT [Bacilli bacterium]
MDKSSKMIRTIVEIAIFAALGFVFDELQGAVAKAIFPNGGSIGFALIAVIIISFRRGPIAGFFTGLIMGVLDFATGPYILGPWQVMLDYILPYAVVAIAGFAKPFFDREENKYIKLVILLVATLVGGLAKFTCHFLSGGIFFAEYISWVEFAGQPWLYSLAYNMAAVGPSIVLTMLLLIPIYFKAPQILHVKGDKVQQTETVPFFDWGVNTILLAGGLFLFVYFLISYIKSYDPYIEDGAMDIGFDQDALVLFCTGGLMMFIAGISIIKSVMKIQDYRLTTILMMIMCSAETVYAVARIIKLTAKNKPVDIYWVWFGASLVLLGAFVALFIYLKKNAKQVTVSENNY